MVKEMQAGTFGSGNSSVDLYKGNLRQGFPYNLCPSNQLSFKQCFLIITYP
jgi:hypothetical protein